jgi:Tfp pilus assembly protein PilN
VRAVNLIPKEQRRGEASSSRSGLISYAIVGVLAVIVLVIVAMTLLNNQISDRKDQVASLDSQVQQSQARAAALAPYVQLANVRDARSVTIDSLAKSRFDWERVLRELALVTPDSISLSGVSGTASPGVEVDGAADVGLRAQVQGPALEIIGCAASQRSLAEYISVLHDIDGVTRVAAQSSVRGSNKKNAPASTSAQSSATECANPADAAFQLVVALEGVPTPVEPPVDGATTTTSTTSTSATSPTTATAAPATVGSDNAVAGAQQQQAQQQQEIANAATKADNATNLIPGG